MRVSKRAMTRVLLSTTVVAVASGAITARDQNGRHDGFDRSPSRRARNVILFIGDGMGVSTITATRVYSVGVAGELVVDQFPYTALSRT